jgi:hypothetical protein
VSVVKPTRGCTMELTNGHKLSKVIQRRFDYCRHMSVIDWMGLEITVNIKVRNDPVTVLSYNVVLIDGTPRRSYCLHLLFPHVILYLRAHLHLITLTFVFRTY